MHSSLDILRKASTLDFSKGEVILDSYTASYDAGNAGFSTWKLGNLHLTGKRLLFVQVKKVLFQIPLSEIRQIDLIKKRWILGKRVPQLYITWNNGRTRNVFIAVKEPHKWKEHIERLITKMIVLSDA
jgi:hypothetical protein